MSGNVLTIGGSCWSFGFSQAQLEKLNSSQGDEEVAKQSAIFRRIRNWIFGVHKADAAKAFYLLANSNTVQEAERHFDKLKQYIGAHADKFQYQYNASDATSRYVLYLDDSEPMIIATGLKEENEAFPGTERVVSERSPLLNANGFPGAVSRTASGVLPRSPEAEKEMSRQWMLFMTLEHHRIPGFGYTFREIFSMTDDQLENKHDFIQLIFPNERVSTFNPRAPLMTETLKGYVQEDEHLRQRIALCVDKMLAFYGLRRDGDNISVNPEATRKHKKWQFPTGSSHHYKRISRMLKFLYGCGFVNCAQSLQQCFRGQNVSYGAQGVWDSIVATGDASLTFR